MVQINFNPIILKDCFNLKVREQCRSCKRYNFSANCPPNVPSVDYFQHLLPLYEKGIIVYNLFDNYDKTEWIKCGKQSSLVIHQEILKIKDNLFKTGHYFVLGLSAGSCKLCEKCTIPCKNPSQSLLPVEATGINVVSLMQKFNINVRFPINDSFYRVGMVLYD